MDLKIFVRYRFGTTGAAGVDAGVNVVVAIDNDSTLLNETYPKDPFRDLLVVKCCQESPHSLF